MMTESLELRVELVWNREFHWSHWSNETNMETAIKNSESIRDSGDGARVKKIRIVDNKTDEVLWPEWEKEYKRKK